MESTEKPATPFFHSLENLSPEDRILFHRFGRGRYIKPPHNIIHHASEAIASVQGNATAVQQHDGASISYAELNQRANILANELRSRHGFSKGDRAVLVFSRSIDMVIFIFAVLKAGGQYVPVDGGVVPVETLGHIISDSDASIVLHMPRYKQKVEESILLAKRRSVTVMNIDDNSDFWAHGDTSSPDVNVGPQDGAYVIYTSGTTGLPKGVDVTHGGVTNTLLLEPAKLGITVGKKVAQQLNVGFDMGAWEILGTLMNGGTLYTRGSGDDNWTKCLQQVDIVISTPTVALKRFPRHDEFPNLETIVVGGEPCPETLANHWAPHANFINACGPTEISVMNTAHLHRAGQRLTIGKPIANTTVYLLDDDENPAPIGEPGTMWVGGAGVSRGYLNLPELTAARYKPDKFTGDGNTMFNTGDLARWLPDGNLETLGRKDDQVKIHGFRVELDGVSRAIEAHPAVTKACALKIGDELWGFYSSHAPVDEKELRETAGTHQPFYAVPNIWWHVAIMPLTANGKIDKKALRNLADTDHHSRSTLFEPNDTDIEKTAALDGDLDVADNDKPEEDSEAVSLPPKKGIHGWRWLRHTALSAYRKLFGIVLVANTTALAVMLHQNRHTNYRLPLSSLATAVSANLLASVLLRQDHIVNLIFWLATRLPTTTPLSIRRHLARVYHYGGIHSGSAIAASTWWLIYTITATLPSPTPIPFQTPIRILSYTILSLLLAIITMAHPTLRAKLHNQFELTHRFAGWTALALVWAHLILTTMSTSKAASFPLGTTILTTPSIYLLSLTTLCIALPWLRLRRVPVRPEPLSAHALRLHFTFTTPRPCSSLGIRITDRPLIEWHAFAAIPSPNGGFSILISKAGDWTSRIIANPPSAIWTRGTPASGVLAVACLFKKVVLVATGSGIGPCLPVIMERKVPCRILWSTRNAERTYGRAILEEVRRADKDAVVWDTDEMGRPDLVRMAWEMYRESGAECVCVVSNGATTRRVVYQLEARGVPAFGPIWDS